MPRKTRAKDFKSLYDIANVRASCVSPRRRGRHEQPSPERGDIPPSPMILPDRPFQAQIIDQLNFGARYLDPHAGMPRNWLSAHNVIIRNVQEYESSANQLENEARALGLLSIDIERREERAASEIERRVLGREMDRTERAYFIRKYSLRPIEDPQIMEQLVIYLRLREENQTRSIAYPVFQYEEQQRQPPRPFPPWFNPEAPRTQDRENESGGKTRVCAECTHAIQPQNRELCPYGYCFVCGDPRDPPPDPKDVWPR
jgi:RNA polymerase-binding transcription factor DksA